MDKDAANPLDFLRRMGGIAQGYAGGINQMGKAQRLAKQIGQLQHSPHINPAALQHMQAQLPAGARAPGLLQQFKAQHHAGLQTAQKAEHEFLKQRDQKAFQALQQQLGQAPQVHASPYASHPAVATPHASAYAATAPKTPMTPQEWAAATGRPGYKPPVESPAPAAQSASTKAQGRAVGAKPSPVVRAKTEQLPPTNAQTPALTPSAQVAPTKAQVAPVATPAAQLAPTKAQVAPAAQPAPAPAAQPAPAPAAQLAQAPIAPPPPAAPLAPPAPFNMSAGAPTPSAPIAPPAPQNMQTVTPTPASSEATAATPSQLSTRQAMGLGAGLGLGGAAAGYSYLRGNQQAAEQDARMRDYMAASRENLTSPPPGLTVYANEHLSKFAQKVAASFMPPDVQAAIARGVGETISNRLIADPIDALGQLFKKRLLDAPKWQHNFDRVVADDPILQDAHKSDPRMLPAAFETIKRFSPAMAKDQLSTRNILRHVVMTGGELDHATVKQLAETQKAYAEGRRQR